MMRAFFPAPAAHKAAGAPLAPTPAFRSRRPSTGEPHAGKTVPPQGPPDHGAHRDPRRDHHLPDHGLRAVRQPEHPRQDRHGSGRGVRRHLPGRRDRLAGHGPLGQLPDRPRPRHGPQRLLHLHRGADHGLHVAGGARRGVPLRRAVLRPVDLPHPRVDHPQHPAAAAHGDQRRHRPVPRADRAEEHRHRRRPPGHPGRPRRPRPARPAARRPRLPAHRRAGPPPRHRGGDDRHPRRHRRGAGPRPDRAGPRGGAAAEPDADPAATGHRRRAGRRPGQRDLRLPVRRPVRHLRHPDRRGAEGRPGRHRRQAAAPGPRPAGRQHGDHGRRRAGHLDHHQLHRVGRRHQRRRAHRADRLRGRRAVPAQPVLLAAGRRGARLRHRPGAVLRRRADGRRPGRHRLGRPQRSRAGADRRAGHAADLLHRQRHRPRLHQLDGDQAVLRPRPRAEQRHVGAVDPVRGQAGLLRLTGFPFRTRVRHAQSLPRPDPLRRPARREEGPPAGAAGAVRCPRAGGVRLAGRALPPARRIPPVARGGRPPLRDVRGRQAHPGADRAVPGGQPAHQ
ncbi:hypothetical protein OF001_U40103 [Pseudomonas sp. OF001]|nr:hypothetical protein OF001_U40103 [Pseudomonas sp. OF001]